MSDTPRPPRSPSIDILRGLIMVIMAIDHSRDFFGGSGVFPNLNGAPLSLFITRWITHFCAPTFILLAGFGARLGLKSKGKTALAKFLFTRGVWLIFLEWTVCAWAWNFSFFSPRHGMAILWAIGWSMITLSGLVFLPETLILALGLFLILAHNSLDGIQSTSFGQFGWIWKILHERGHVGSSIQIAYPLIPWPGVIAVGYWVGGIWQRPSPERIQWFARTGAIFILVFIVVRLTNIYGDPARWASQTSSLFTVESFLNVTKYPPSLDFLLVTLGGSFVMLAAIERFPGRFWQEFEVFGRVPLLFYVAHLYVLHAAALILALATYGHLESLNILSHPPSGYGNPLWIAYIAWALCVLCLYPICRKYSEIKRRSKHPWLSYL